MDYVIRFEDLLAGVKHVCEQVQVGFARRKLRNFVSGHRPKDLCLADYYDAATKDRVAKHFRFELEQFDYGFPE